MLKAIEHLRSWNHSTNKENRQAILAILTMRKISRSDKPKDHSPEALRKALTSSVDYLRKYHGSYDLPWGEVNRLIRGDVNLAIDGGPDILRAIYSFGLKENEPAYSTHGDTWMAIVEWDKAGQISAEVLHQFGSATKNQNSPHYSDQATLFVNKQWRQALIDLDDIRKNAERSYFPSRSLVTN